MSRKRGTLDLSRWHNCHFESCLFNARRRQAQFAGNWFIQLANAVIMGGKNHLNTETKEKTAGEWENWITVNTRLVYKNVVDFYINANTEDALHHYCHWSSLYSKVRKEKSDFLFKYHSLRNLLPQSRTLDENTPLFLAWTFLSTYQ